MCSICLRWPLHSTCQLLGTFVNGDPDFDKKTLYGPSAVRPNGKYRVFVLTGAQVLIAKKVLFTLCQGP